MKLDTFACVTKSWQLELPFHQQLIIKSLVESENSDNKRFYMNQQFTGVLSTVNKIKTNMRSDVDDKDGGDEVDEYNDIKKVNKWVTKQLSMNQMQMRHDHSTRGYLYIEKVKLLSDPDVYATNDKERGLYHRI